MSIETALYELVTTDATLLALVGRHVYPVLIPQDVETPALAYQVISQPGQYAHDGDVGLLRTRVQWTGQASTYAELRAVMGALRARLSAYTGVVDGETIQALFVENMRDQWSGTFDRPAATMDVVVWHRA